MNRTRRWLARVGLVALTLIPISASAGADSISAAAKPTLQISFSFEGNEAPKVGRPYKVYVQLIPHAIAGTLTLSTGSLPTSQTLVRRVTGKIVMFVVRFPRGGSTTLRAHFVGKAHPNVTAVAKSVIRVSP